MALHRGGVARRGGGGEEGTADYLSQLPGSGEDGETTEAEPLTREKLQGCAEVWGMEPFLDRDLFNTLANAGK